MKVVMFSNFNPPKYLIFLFNSFFRTVGVLFCLYVFICSLDILTISFRLLSGRSGGALFSNSEILQNPIVGVMIGVISTVLIQSSSTTSSIIVGMVGSGVLSIKYAIPIVMGANVGTSVTNTIVALTQVADRKIFERSFSCAVLHDMFNWLAVLTFLVIEVVTGYLYKVTDIIVESFHINDGGQHPPEFLHLLTKPLAELIIIIDENVLEGWIQNDPKYTNITTLLKASCERTVDGKVEKYECGYLFAGVNIEDMWIGLILVICSLLVLISCLVFLVKILNSLMEAQIARVIQKVLNANIPYFPWLTGYLAIFVGSLITILVQSSSVFTCTLTPLVGTGFFELERAYPLTLGSNIGTTTTGILAALASEGRSFRPALQIALCHLLFNVSGILVFYPIPFMRWPLPMAKVMGKTVAKYRWFAIVYLILSFIVLPLIVFNFSLLLGGNLGIYLCIIPLMLISLLITLINILQKRYPNLLPKFLENWNFLPLFMRSLSPYDSVFTQIWDHLKKCSCR
uniref:Solute carrier family 34 (Type II sodium/phosphate contransporter), member 2 [Xenopus laevis] n=1 Tax=Lepeophtheirus salmonis TaxID=72036 RepID=A0A0K2UXF9_LEPSM